MKHGTYVGQAIAFQGQTALLRESDDPAMVLVQFDNLKDFPNLAHGWHAFLASEWKIDEETIDE